MSDKFLLKAGAGQTSPQKPAEPTTYGEAVAAERTAWGDSWPDKSHDKRDPLPRACLDWKIASEGHLRIALAFGREFHAKSLQRRVEAQQLTQPQADLRMAKGDELRTMVAEWMERDHARGRGGKWQDAVGKRPRLAMLVALKMLPRPVSGIVREWLHGPSEAGGRGPIDHEQRMRDAEGVFDAVAP